MMPAEIFRLSNPAGLKDGKIEFFVCLFEMARRDLLGNAALAGPVSFALPTRAPAANTARCFWATPRKQARQSSASTATRQQTPTPSCSALSCALTMRVYYAIYMTFANLPADAYLDTFEHNAIANEANSWAHSGCALAARASRSPHCT